MTKTKKTPSKTKKSDEEENTYEVEKIVDSKMIGGVKHYLIKWKGYDSADNTWEEEANVTKCQMLLKKFAKEQEEKSVKTKKEGESSSSSNASSPIPSPVTRSSAKKKRLEENSSGESEVSDSPSFKRFKQEMPHHTTTTTTSTSITTTVTKPAVAKKERDEIKNDSEINFSSSYPPPTDSYNIELNSNSGYEYKDRVEEILGCKKFEERGLYFYVKWYKTDTPTWVSNPMIRLRDPQLLLDFYEERIQFGK